MNKCLSFLMSAVLSASTLHAVAALAVASAAVGYLLRGWPGIVAAVLPLWLLAVLFLLLLAMVMGIPSGVPARWQRAATLGSASVALFLVWSVSFYLSEPAPVAVQPDSRYYVFDDLRGHYVPVERDSFDRWSGAKVANETPTEISLEAPSLTLLELLTRARGKLELPPARTLSELSLASQREALYFLLIDAPARFVLLFSGACALSLILVSRTLRSVGDMTPMLVCGCGVLLIFIGPVGAWSSSSTEPVPGDVSYAVLVMTCYALCLCALLLGGSDSSGVRSLSFVLVMVFVCFFAFIACREARQAAKGGAAPPLRAMTIHPSHGFYSWRHGGADRPAVSQHKE